MAKVSYASLKLKTKADVSTFNFCDNEIEVLSYLPIEDKYDLIMITLQKAEEDGIYNPVLLDMYFHLHLVYMYSNLSFTDKQKENEPKLYDTLVSNGFFEGFLNCFNEEEYDDLWGYIAKIREMRMKYKNTAAAVIQSIIQDLPRNAKAAAEIVENFNPEQFQSVIDFATAANGGRNIVTNR